MKGTGEKQWMSKNGKIGIALPSGGVCVKVYVEIVNKVKTMIVGIIIMFESLLHRIKTMVVIATVRNNNECHSVYPLTSVHLLVETFCFVVRLVVLDG